MLFLKRNASAIGKGTVLLYIAILLDKIFKQQFIGSKRDFHFHQGYYTKGCNQFLTIPNTTKLDFVGLYFIPIPLNYDHTKQF